MSPAPTTDRRRKRVQDDLEQQAARQLRKDVVHLLKDPAFHRYAAHIWYGRLRLESDPCRSSAFEAQRAAARVGVAVELMAELNAIDRAGVRLIQAAHQDRVDLELELADALAPEIPEPPTEEEQTDAS